MLGVTIENGLIVPSDGSWMNPHVDPLLTPSSHLSLRLKAQVVGALVGTREIMSECRNLSSIAFWSYLSVLLR